MCARSESLPSTMGGLLLWLDPYSTHIDTTAAGPLVQTTYTRVQRTLHTEQAWELCRWSRCECGGRREREPGRTNGDSGHVSASPSVMVPSSPPASTSPSSTAPSLAGRWRGASLGGATGAGAAATTDSRTCCTVAVRLSPPAMKSHRHPASLLANPAHDAKSIDGMRPTCEQASQTLPTLSCT